MEKINLKNSKNITVKNKVLILYAIFLSSVILIPLATMHYSLNINIIAFVTLVLILFFINKKIFEIYYKFQSFLIGKSTKYEFNYNNFLIPTIILGVGSLILFIISNYYLFLDIDTLDLDINYIEIIPNYYSKLYLISISLSTAILFVSEVYTLTRKKIGMPKTLISTILPILTLAFISFIIIAIIIKILM